MILTNTCTYVCINLDRYTLHGSQLVGIWIRSPACCDGGTRTCVIARCCYDGSDYKHCHDAGTTASACHSRENPCFSSSLLVANARVRRGMQFVLQMVLNTALPPPQELPPPNSHTSSELAALSLSQRLSARENGAFDVESCVVKAHRCLSSAHRRRVAINLLILCLILAVPNLTQIMALTGSFASTAVPSPLQKCSGLYFETS